MALEAAVPPPAAITLTDGTGVNTKLDKFATNYPLLVGATLLQQHGITGKGITIAVLDTGLWTDGPDNFKLECWPVLIWWTLAPSP